MGTFWKCVLVKFVLNKFVLTKDLVYVSSNIECLSNIDEMTKDIFFSAWDESRDLSVNYLNKCRPPRFALASLLCPAILYSFVILQRGHLDSVVLVLRLAKGRLLSAAPWRLSWRSRYRPENTSNHSYVPCTTWTVKYVLIRLDKLTKTSSK